LRVKPVKSIHVFAFSGDRKLLLNESDGVFAYEEWDEACELAEEVCCKEDGLGGGVGLEQGDSMEVDGKSGQNLEEWLRDVVRRKVESEQRWRVAT
jgi:exosome complex component RRP46